ncbi:MAG: SRPBCC domain-containing protein [Bacteroidia bacterium]|nr:SRPBCC domain-containing protein [Bacteroidia bacterium]
MASIKQKFQMEFEMRSSPKILYNYISTASGLSEWFADDVRVKEGVYFFKWEGTESRAKLTHKRENQMARFNWIDETEKTYFEIEIITDEITGDIALLISDFAEPEEQAEMRRLWDSQILNLRHIIGS